VSGAKDGDMGNIGWWLFVVLTAMFTMAR